MRTGTVGRTHASLAINSTLEGVIRWLYTSADISLVVASVPCTGTTYITERYKIYTYFLVSLKEFWVVWFYSLFVGVLNNTIK